MSARDHLPEMIALYREGAYMAEIGRAFGITRERVRQLFEQAGVERRKGMAALRPADFVARIAKFRAAPRPPRAALPHVLEAVDLVRAGMSYGEAAKRLGITRNAVAGACHRADVKVGLDARKRAKLSAMMVDTWADPAEHKRRSAKISRGHRLRAEQEDA